MSLLKRKAIGLTCYINTWLIFEWQLTNIPQTVDWYTTDSWPIYHRHMTDSKSRCVIEISTDARPIVYPTLNWLSTGCWPTIDRLSTDHRPTVDLLSIAISTALSTDISVDITYSKQDPVHLHILCFLINKYTKHKLMIIRCQSQRLIWHRSESYNVLLSYNENKN